MDHTLYQIRSAEFHAPGQHVFFFKFVYACMYQATYCLVMPCLFLMLVNAKSKSKSNLKLRQEVGSSTETVIVSRTCLCAVNARHYICHRFRQT